MKILLGFVISLNIYSIEELITKQDINNIRFISKDGKLTYYKRRSGPLIQSTNYSIAEVIKGNKFDDYLIITSLSRKKMIYEHKIRFHKKNNVRALSEILVSEWGKTKVEPLGKGVSPQLHLADTYVTFFDTYSRNIIIKSLTRKFSYNHKIKNKKNPYFVPQVYILNQEEVIYTDIDKNGNQAIMFLNLLTKDNRTLLKTKSNIHRFELCLNSKNIIIGEFSFYPHPAGSEISQIAQNRILKIDEKKELYTSTLNDLGNIACNDRNVFFIHEVKKRQEIAKLNILTKKINNITNNGPYTSIFDQDGQIYTSKTGKIFILEGNKLKDDKL